MTEPTAQPLRLLRLSTGLTLREVSRRTGINSGRLSIIERGVPPTAEERARIVAVLMAPTSAEGGVA